MLFCAYPDAYRAVLVFAEPESLEADGGMDIRSALTHVVADAVPDRRGACDGERGHGRRRHLLAAADARGAVAVRDAAGWFGAGARGETGASRGGRRRRRRRRGRRGRRLLPRRGTEIGVAKFVGRAASCAGRAGVGPRCDSRSFNLGLLDSHGWELRMAMRAAASGSPGCMLPSLSQSSAAVLHASLQLGRHRQALRGS